LELLRSQKKDTTSVENALQCIHSKCKLHN
jgi:hypothetical protein